MNTDKKKDAVPVSLVLRDGYLEVRGDCGGLRDKLRYYRKEIGREGYDRKVVTTHEDLFDESNDEQGELLVTMPGFAHKVLEYFRSNGIPWRFMDARTPMPAPNYDRAFQGLRPYQVPLVGRMLKSGGGILHGSTGMGKALPNKSKIPTPSGWRTVGEIKVGDSLFGSYGDPVKVLAVYPQPEKRRVYEIEFSDGRVVECCEDHLWTWTVRKGGRDFWRTTSTNELEAYMRSGFVKGRAPKVPLCKPALYPERKLPVDPYVLGALIGNGCLKERILVISSGNSFVPDKIASILGTTAHKMCAANFSYSFKAVEPRTGRNGRVISYLLTHEILTGCCRDLVGSVSSEKFIPRQYLTASPFQRLRLLQGLIDTDGSIDWKGRVNYSTTSRKLACDVAELARGMGLIAKVSEDNRAGKYKSGEGFNVHIRCSPEFKHSITTLPEKLERVKYGVSHGNRHESNDVIRIVEVRKTDRYEDMTCFTVDAEDSLFLCGDYIVTHNTCCAAAVIRAYDRAELCSRGTPLCVFACPDRDINRKNWEEFHRWLPDRNIGLIMSGSKNVQSDDVVCCTIDSLEHIDPDSVGVLIVDEMHTSASRTRSERIAMFQKARKWGVSATPTGRFDGADAVSEGLYGPVVATFSYQDGVKSGALVPITVLWLPAPPPMCGLSTYGKFKKRDAKIRHGSTINDDFAMAVAEIFNCTPKDTQILGVMQFIEQMQHVSKFCPGTGCVHAETNPAKLASFPNVSAIKPSDRKRLYDAFRTGELTSMLSTMVWSTGVDFPDLSVVVNIGGGGSDIVAKQIPGRASRKSDGKDHAYIVDFVHKWDREDPESRSGRPGPLLSNDFARRRAYKSLGFEQVSCNRISELPFVDQEKAGASRLASSILDPGTTLL